jgi:hypothetical protein
MVTKFQSADEALVRMFEIMLDVENELAHRIENRVEVDGTKNLPQWDLKRAVRSVALTDKESPAER